MPALYNIPSPFALISSTFHFDTRILRLVTTLGNSLSQPGTITLHFQSEPQILLFRLPPYVGSDCYESSVQRIDANLKVVCWIVESILEKYSYQCGF
ncbi:uncharacterized protein H6S33_001379 [Morchella sextelata]|uniref:uncharacterized protein n=1 Tax=Morchella sextelata TaxID=1174677 RepID=UPI001D041D1A|nr:uncharacterized protein H6S33_001379 [Morchella sextelata]KAH0609151.1 hypothetical protein H6S33_001379 [Morchella sextelata]